jgi:hypothetical protein
MNDWSPINSTIFILSSNSQGERTENMSKTKVLHSVVLVLKFEKLADSTLYKLIVVQLGKKFCDFSGTRI